MIEKIMEFLEPAIKFWVLGAFADNSFLFNENLLFFILSSVGIAILSYFVGSINCSLLISKIYGKDVRDGGSGNAGATNMTRQFGKKAGIMTFLGDFFKAFILAGIGLVFSGMLGGLIAGFFCIIGHAYPVYFKFRGGKGFSSMVAIMIVTNPVVFSIVGSIYLILLFGTRMVSFAAVMTMVIYPFVLSLIFQPGAEVLVATLCALMIIFLHRKNIVRIFNHTEPKINLGKKKKKTEAVSVEENNDENSEK